MKTNTTTAEKLLDAARQQKLSLPESLRETAMGGIAATPTACRLAQKTGCSGCIGCG